MPVGPVDRQPEAPNWPAGAAYSAQGRDGGCRRQRMSINAPARQRSVSKSLNRPSGEGGQCAGRIQLLCLSTCVYKLQRPQRELQASSTLCLLSRPCYGYMTEFRISRGCRRNVEAQPLPSPNDVATHTQLQRRSIYSADFGAEILAHSMTPNQVPLPQTTTASRLSVRGLVSSECAHTAAPAAPLTTSSHAHPSP